MTARDPIQFEGIHCKMTITPLAPRLVVLTLSGRDIGEFRDEPMRQLEALLPSSEACTLFIDARQVEGASVDVSNDWAQWLKTSRARFEHVSMLTGSPFIRLTADFVRRFAELGDIMRIYTDAAAFDQALEQARDEHLHEL